MKKRTTLRKMVVSVVGSSVACLLGLASACYVQVRKQCPLTSAGCQLVYFTTYHDIDIASRGQPGYDSFYNNGSEKCVYNCNGQLTKAYVEFFTTGDPCIGTSTGTNN